MSEARFILCITNIYILYNNIIIIIIIIIINY